MGYYKIYPALERQKAPHEKTDNIPPPSLWERRHPGSSRRWRGSLLPLSNPWPSQRNGFSD